MEPPTPVTLTTAEHVPGREIAETIDVITSECVYGVNALRDIAAGFRDFFGGRSAAMEKVLKDARRECAEGLRQEARLIGADAVIAVRLDSTSIGGSSVNMLCVVATGTAVRLVPAANP